MASGIAIHNTVLRFLSVIIVLDSIISKIVFNFDIVSIIHSFKCMKKNMLNVKAS